MFSLGRALALFDMPLPSHLSRAGTCYLGDSNILFFFFFSQPPLCLPLPHCVPLIPVLTHTHTQQGQPVFLPLSLSLSLSPSSLSLPLSLSPSPSICWESLRQLRSETAALQTKEGAARSTATYLVCYTMCRPSTLGFWHLFIDNAALLFKDLKRL